MTSKEPLVPLGRQQETATSGREALGTVSERRGGLGLDLGHFATRFHLLAGDQSHHGEISGRGRSLDEVLTEVAAEIERAPIVLRGVETLGVAVDLGGGNADLLFELLAEKYPSIRLERAELNDPRIVPWFAVERAGAGPLWVLDVGWQEVRLFALIDEGDGPRVRTSKLTSRYHGQLVDKGILTTLREFQIVADADAAYGDIDGKVYREALHLKHQLAYRTVVVAGAERIRIRDKVFAKDLLTKTAWRDFPAGLVDAGLRPSMEHDEGDLVLAGASCRLPWLARWLTDKLPSNLRCLSAGGDDPGQVRAMGLAVHAVGVAASVAAAGQPAREAVPAAASEPAPALDAEGNGDAELPAHDEPSEWQPVAVTDRESVDRMMLRLDGDLAPMFQISDGKAQSRRIDCAPVPEYLYQDGVARVELQVFLAAENASPGCPRFLGGRSFQVPAYAGGYNLSFRLLQQSPLRLKVRVLTSDDKLFDKEIDWHVEETADIV